MFILAKTGYSASLVFYDAMLTDVTEPERMDTVSSQGYAWGYIGSCIPFIASLVIVLCGDKIGLSMQASMVIAFIITAIWWLLSAVPLLISFEQKHYVGIKGNVVKTSFVRLGHTFQEIWREKHIFLFMVAFFFYIDGVYTIIDMATAYGQALGLDSTGLLLALLVTQLVAFPSVLVLNVIAEKIKPTVVITICILGYLFISIFAYGLNTQLEFWILAVLVGMFQGTIQALSRSYFGKIIPAEKSGEYFGLYDICGKGAAILGTVLVSVITQVTGKMNVGVSAISVLFIIGLICFRKAVKLNEERQSNE